MKLSARVDFAVGRRDATTAELESLRALDREIGVNEAALDRVHEMLKPNAERRRDQRTRAAALLVARERLALAQRTLIELGLPAERIEIRPVRVEIDGEAELGSVLVATHERQ